MLGNRIKRYLDSKGIRYSYLSEKTGIPANILSPMLNGKREIKAMEYFLICSALDVPLETFAETKGETPAEVAPVGGEG